MFTVMAERWTGTHRYIVGVYKDYEQAVAAIQTEWGDRGGKYCKFYLQTWDEERGSELEELQEIFELPCPF